ncbi:hypothetical protein ONA91_35620 [Micromonospora sp. DR5-3]|uniref:hypothetical protein n=1 Tax=Micromonospora sp. DR5-3 TaxID=2992129 RepID=UPI0011E6B6F3|nr:hypothetical protein [Micromonospora sp. DR5-3]MCW3819779.1 hypothetical protein [Micromonospora sp. DR5-3]
MTTLLSYGYDDGQPDLPLIIASSGGGAAAAVRARVTNVPQEGSDAEHSAAIADRARNAAAPGPSRRTGDTLRHR